MSSKKSDYRNIGSLNWQSEFSKEGKPLKGQYKKDDKGKTKFAISLNKDIKVTIDGVDMTGKTLYLDSMENVNNGKLQRGVISQEEYDSKMADYGPEGRLEFVRYQITAKLS